MTEDGPYGSFGGDPWTDVGTFMENGPLTAIKMYARDGIEGLRARYNKILLLVFTKVIKEKLRGARFLWGRNIADGENKSGIE